MIIAIVSKDGQHVDEHFGRAERFWVYESTPTGLQNIGERPTVPLSVGNPDHPFDADRFNAVYDVIKDCERVYVKRIGKKPAAELKNKGIEPIEYDGAIMDIKI